LVPPERFELPTFGLQNRCTTTVLKGLKIGWLTWARTRDNLINSQGLYQLSYKPS